MHVHKWNLVQYTLMECLTEFARLDVYFQSRNLSRLEKLWFLLDTQIICLSIYDQLFGALPLMFRVLGSILRSSLLTVLQPGATHSRPRISEGLHSAVLWRDMLCQSSDGAFYTQGMCSIYIPLRSLYSAYWYLFSSFDWSS